MAHYRIPSGSRYTLCDGVEHENTLSHDIFVDRMPIFLGGKVEHRYSNALPPGDPVHLLNTRMSSFEWVTPPKWVDTWPTPRDFWDDRRGKTDTPFPAFVPPERPAEPVEPAPAPESAAVVTLRRLLEDRRRVLRNAVYEVEGSTADIKDLEADLVRLRKDLAHEETVVEAARVEVNQVIDSIRALGGKVEEA